MLKKINTACLIVTTIISIVSAVWCQVFLKHLVESCKRG